MITTTTKTKCDTKRNPVCFFLLFLSSSSSSFLTHAYKKAKDKHISQHTAPRTSSTLHFLFLFHFHLFFSVCLCFIHFFFFLSLRLSVCVVSFFLRVFLSCCLLACLVFKSMSTGMLDPVRARDVPSPLSCHDQVVPSRLH